MLLQLKTLDIICTMPELDRIPAGKILINTINVHSYNTAQEDKAFAEVPIPSYAIYNIGRVQPGDVTTTYADTTALEHDFGFTPR